ncbi:coilin-like isoform X2 [Physella acuta]|uniref:coilin-like isoform X2 n=1 Tax=Physella acuta TaxID=109671 RepID=UPI0027DBF4D1|nr:coilin-like isoform X2 [Physella acuta]
MAASGKRGDSARLKIKIFPTDIIINSQQHAFTMDPFWMMVYFSECPTIRDVKTKIVSRLNMRSNKIKFIKKLAQSSFQGLQKSLCDVSHLNYNDYQNNNITTLTQNSSIETPVALASLESSSNSVNRKPNVLFESCQISIDGCLLPSSELSEILKDDDFVSVKVKCKIHEPSCENQGISESSHGEPGLFNTEAQPSLNGTEVNHKISVSQKSEPMLKDESSRKHKKKRKHRSEVGTDDLIENQKKRNKTENKRRKESSSEVGSSKVLVSQQTKPNESCFVGSGHSQEVITSGTTSKAFNYKQSNLIINPINGSLKKDKSSSKNKTSKNEILLVGSENDVRDVAQENVDKAKDSSDACTVRSSGEEVEEDIQSLIQQKILQLQEASLATDKTKLSDESSTPDAGKTKRKRVRKRKKKNSIFDKTVEKVETKPTVKDYNLNLPYHLMPQNSRVTFDGCSDDENNEDISMITTDNGVDDSHQELNATPTVVVGKESSNKQFKENASISFSYAPDNAKPSFKVPCSSTPVPTQISTKENKMDMSKSSPAATGVPINPADKFQQLLNQRGYTGRKLEVTHTDSGHALCVSYREKRDRSSAAANPDTDELVNVSTVMQHPSVRSDAIENTFHQKQTVVKDTRKSSTDSIDGLPQIGDIITFKVLELSEDYQPVMSDFKEAKVLNVNAQTQSVQYLFIHV